MRWRLTLVLLVLGGLVLLLSWLFYFRHLPVEKSTVTAQEIEIPTPTPAPPKKAILLFAGADGLLHPEIRQLALPAERDLRIRNLVEALLEGPRGSLFPIFPYQAELRAVFVDLHNHAYLDFSAPENFNGGTNVEAMMVYGVVDTILLNTKLKSVQLLFDGHEIETLGGHLDLSRPLSLNKRFIGR